MRNIVPIKMYEYLASSKPVFCTNLSGIMKEFGEENGIHFVKNQREMIGEIKRLVNSDYLINLGEKARKTV